MPALAVCHVTWGWADADIVRAKRQKHRTSANPYTASLRPMSGRISYDHACNYCSLIGPLEQDHRVPLARGGTNWIENILPACRACNASKHLLTEDEFRASLGAERVAF